MRDATMITVSVETSMTVAPMMSVTEEIMTSANDATLILVSVGTGTSANGGMRLLAKDKENLPVQKGGEVLLIDVLEVQEEIHTFLVADLGVTTQPKIRDRRREIRHTIQNETR